MMKMARLVSLYATVFLCQQYSDTGPVVLLRRTPLFHQRQNCTYAWTLDAFILDTAPAVDLLNRSKGTWGLFVQIKTL